MFHTKSQQQKKWFNWMSTKHRCSDRVMQGAHPPQPQHQAVREGLRNGPKLPPPGRGRRGGGGVLSSRSAAASPPGPPDQLTSKSIPLVPCGVEENGAALSRRWIHSPR